ncbi:MAG: TonB family protein [Acidobacteriia bacterium]|nr:TonB family protein [Terriglobia bacterium]
MQSSPALASAAVAMARRSQLEGRLIAILDSRVNRKTAGRASALAAVVAAVAMVAPFAAVRAQDQATSPKPARPATPASGSGGQRADDGGALAQLRDPEKRPNPPQGAVVFKSQARDNPPESANELMHLGVIALRDKNYPQAIDFFQRSQGLDPKLAGRTQMWMALANERESNTPDADALYRSALALADPDSKDAATVMELYARFLKDQGRSEEAKPMSDRATELRKSPAPVTTAMRIGAGVSPPRIVSKVDPEYTDEARAAKYEGTVVLFVELDPDGIARNIQVVKSLGLGLDDKAIAAVSQWRFNPAQKNGEPVTVQATIEVNFRLL